MTIKICASWTGVDRDFPITVRLEMIDDDSDDNDLSAWAKLSSELTSLGMIDGVDYIINKDIVRPARYGIPSTFVSLSFKSDEQLTLFKIKYHG